MPANLKSLTDKEIKYFSRFLIKLSFSEVANLVSLIFISQTRQKKIALKPRENLWIVCKHQLSPIVTHTTKYIEFFSFLISTSIPVSSNLLNNSRRGLRQTSIPYFFNDVSIWNSNSRQSNNQGPYSHLWDWAI